MKRPLTFVIFILMRLCVTALVPPRKPNERFQRFGKGKSFSTRADMPIQLTKYRSFKRQLVDHPDSLEFHLQP